jgi:hypothetical protein
MRIRYHHPSFHWFLISGVAIAVLSRSSAARADVVLTTEKPAPPSEEASVVYPLEIEPHMTFGSENLYGTSGFGAGLRLGVPLAYGHLGSVPQNLAISFGADVLHYDNCFFGSDCGANYLIVPVAAQWNIFVARQVSVFGEAGAYVYKGWFAGCGPGDGPDCSPPSDFGLLPTIALGGRFHVGTSVALTLRLGYPTTTLGVSFL